VGEDNENDETAGLVEVDTVEDGVGGIAVDNDGGEVREADEPRRGWPPDALGEASEASEEGEAAD
jgi:hypothetical protein